MTSIFLFWESYTKTNTQKKDVKQYKTTCIINICQISKRNNVDSYNNDNHSFNWQFINIFSLQGTILDVGDAVINKSPCPQEAYLRYGGTQWALSCLAGEEESKGVKEAERQKEQGGTRRKKRVRREQDVRQ